MVRILKVRHLEERRRQLVARSDLYRQALHRDVVALKQSASTLKRRFSFLRTIGGLLGMAAPVAGLLAARRRKRTDNGNGGGFLSRFLSGLKFAAALLRMLQKSDPSPTAPEPGEDSPAASGLR